MNRLLAPQQPVSQSLRHRLRESTSDIHRRLDSTLTTTGSLSSLGRYTWLLTRLLGLHRPLERLLARIDWTGSGFDSSARFKSHWIAADLAKLGVSEDDIPTIADCPSLPYLASRHDGLGAFYVLEGATLGARVISRQILQTLGIRSDNGGRFFAAYGEETGARWQEFVRAIDLHSGDQHAERAIERSAVATFMCFETWLCGSASEEAIL